MSNKKLDFEFRERLNKIIGGNHHNYCYQCGSCVAVCPAQVLVMIEEDPMEQVLVAAVSDEHRRKIKESCAPCKPTGHDSPTLPCVAACESVAIQHSW